MLVSFGSRAWTSRPRFIPQVLSHGARLMWPWARQTLERSPHWPLVTGAATATDETGGSPDTLLKRADSHTYSNDAELLLHNAAAIRPVNIGLHGLLPEAKP